MAWEFAKTTGRKFGECLKIAWANSKVKKALYKGIAHFRFIKVDGSIREAWGTLKVEYQATSERRPNESVQTYFDTEKQEWRCFKKMNLLGMA